MARKKTGCEEALAHACKAQLARLRSHKTETDVIEIINSELEGHNANECGWDGGMNHVLSSDSEFCWTDSDAECSDSDEFTKLYDEELNSLAEESEDDQLQAELASLAIPMPHEALVSKKTSSKECKEAERNWIWIYWKCRKDAATAQEKTMREGC